MSEVLSLDVSHTDSETTLRVTGEIHMDNSPQLRAALIQVCDEQPERVVVDLAGLTYIESSGIATLVEALQRTRQAGGQLVLRGLSERIMGVFRLTRLDKVFSIVD